MTFPAPNPTIKIYGERNTGTNYLTDLLNQNLVVRLLPGVVPNRIGRVASRADRAARKLRVDGLRPGEHIKDWWFASTFRSNLGWKHMHVSIELLSAYDLAEQTIFVTLTKNPYSWIISLFKRPYHGVGDRRQTLADFASSPWRTVGREHGPQLVSTPMALWNMKNSAYSELDRARPTVRVLYEDLISDPDKVIEMVRSRAGASAKGEAYTNVLASTKGDRGKSFSFYRAYYLDQQWRAELDSVSVAAINETMDSDLAESFGYQILDSSDFPK